MNPNSCPQAQLSAAALRLVCFPFAGGGTAVYCRWRSALPAWIDLAPVTLPGHDGRLNESPCTDIHKLVILLADELQPLLDRPYALLGHSMGGWLAFELAREFRRRSTPLPSVLVVSACPAPHEARRESPLHALPDDEMLAAVERRYGGIPSSVRDSPELLQLLLPALRADLQMVESYRYVDEPPLEVEILVLGGTDDPIVSAAQLYGWRRHSTVASSVRMFPGGHFFLFDGGAMATAGRPQQSREILPAVWMIVTRLQKCLSANPSGTKSAMG